jgi:uroporphyrinogen-III synthase
LAVVIIKEMEALGHDRLPLLYLCGNIRRDELPTALKEVLCCLLFITLLFTRSLAVHMSSLMRAQADIAFEELEVYETLASPSLPSDLAFGRRHAGGRGQRQVDWMCFFSPSGVKAIHEELHKPHGDVEDEEEERNGEGVSYGPRLAAIGPTTAKALIETFGVASSDAIAVASQPCALGLFDAIERHSSNSSTKQRP